MNHIRPQGFLLHLIVIVSAIATLALVIYALLLVPSVSPHDVDASLMDEPMVRPSPDHSWTEERRSTIAGSGSAGANSENSAALDTSFEELFEQLVEIYLAGMQANARNDTGELKQISTSASELLQSLLRFADAGPDSLEIALRLPANVESKSMQ
ncbi:MAG: hypothetical protein VX951_13720, partial [Planctomycetota bacterium]|nr:hypothetical protein [Planctomycetota bacterium]